MPDEIPPVVVPVPAPVPPTAPTTAQVVSAAVQNAIAIVALTAGWLTDKLSAEFAVIAILLVVGIDFAGRRRLPGTVIGATGVFGALGGFGGVALSLLAALGLAGCGAALDLGPVGHGLKAGQELYLAACEDPTPKLVPVCEKAYDALNVAADAYTVANDAAKEAGK